jgi:UDP-2,3-diacylglucosamine hydrolase
MGTLFASDVHLSAANPTATAAFIKLTGGPARHATALYLLGDVFDVWLGDDDLRDPHSEILDALAELTASGVPVGVLHGNHDFLLSQSFADRTGCVLHTDPAVIEIDGTPIGICHGDHLCVDDVEYQQWRTYSREPANQRAFLDLPLNARIEQAAAIQTRSRQAVIGKSDAIMDVNPDAVNEAFETLAVDTLIHGHTHRPAHHEIQVGGRLCRRFVLDSWYAESNVLLWQEGTGKACTVDELSALL